MDSKPVCKNCNTPLYGKYCYTCGQKNLNFSKPFREVVAELLSPIADIDAQLFKTIYEYFRYPGRVPANYTEGKQKRYLPPIRLFFICMVLFFAVYKYSGALQIEFADSPTETTTGTGKSAETFAGLDLSEKQKAIRKHPEQFTNTVFATFPYTFFLSLPLFSLISWLFFMISRPYYLSHLVFNATIQTVWLILLLPSFILLNTVSQAVSYVYLIAIGVYLIAYTLVAMKTFFRCKIWYIIPAYLGISVLNAFAFTGILLFSTLVSMLMM